MKATNRLAGGQPSGRTHVMMIRVHKETYRWLASHGRPAATEAAEQLDRIVAEASKPKSRPHRLAQVGAEPGDRARGPGRRPSQRKGNGAASRTTGLWLLA